MVEGPWGQAVPTRSLNQKPCHLGEFRFSNPKVRPDPRVRLQGLTTYRRITSFELRH